MVVKGCPAPHMFPRSQRRRLGVIALVFVIGTLLLCYTSFEGMTETARRIIPTAFDSSQQQQASGDNPLDLSFADVSAALQQPIPPMAYGTYGRPPLRGLIPLAALPATKVPTPTPPPYRRLIIIGDVHGQRQDLEKLLERIGYQGEEGGDHVVFAGDMVSKGSDSAGVVKLAMEMRASAVRGNHEDRMLLAWESANKHNVLGPKELKRDVEGQQQHEARDSNGGTPEWAKGWKLTDKNRPPPMSEEEKGDIEAEEAQKQKQKQKADTAAEQRDDMAEPVVEAEGGKLRRELELARSLTPEQREWLAGLPVILKVGPVAGYGNVVVVHGGLVPNVPLENQDPWAVMHVRSLAYPAREAQREAIRKALEELASERAGKHVDVTDADVEREFDLLLDAETSSRKNKDKDSDEPDPEDVAVPLEDRKGRPWSEAWNEAQFNIADEDQRMTVIYGHDAGEGLNVQPYTFGLDTNCARGGRLTALIFQSVNETETETETADSEGSDVDAESKKKKKKSKKGKKKGKGKDEDGGEQGGQGIGHSIVSVGCSEAEPNIIMPSEVIDEKRRKRRSAY